LQYGALRLLKSLTLFKYQFLQLWVCYSTQDKLRKIGRL